MSPTLLEDVSNCPISLPEYARIIGYDECALYGVYYEGQIDYDCRMFWTEWQRMDVYRALQEAQELMESVLGYALCPTWVTGESDDYSSSRYVDTQDYVNPILTRYCNFIVAGVRAESNLSLLETIDHNTDPATIGPIAVTINDTSEVHIYYPGTRKEIKPSSMTYIAGNLTIYVPRCRLVAIPNTIDIGLDYNVLANFLDELDVVRIYNDPSVAATLVAPHTCSLECRLSECGEYTTTGCIYPFDKRLGIVNVSPATYASGVWTNTSGCHGYSIARLNYIQGLYDMGALMKSALVRLAHARMAAEPCGCNIVQRLWERDRKTPDILSRERLNCPFGVSEGAWTAYKTVQRLRISRMSII